MIIKLKGGRTTSMSYARWMMTQKLGRRLLPSEHVDHVNDRTLDDRLGNFQILTPGQNAKKSNVGKPSPFKGIERGWAHATIYSWRKKHCTCRRCRRAKKVWTDKRNAARRKRSPGGTGRRSEI